MSEPIKKRKTYPTYKSFPFLGKVVSHEGKNKIQLNSLPNYNYFLNQVCKLGDDVAMYITNKRPKRSELQNSYYWVYLSLICLSSGHSKEELHEWAKGEFLHTGTKEIFGRITKTVRSTTDLTVGEFCEYLIDIEEATEIPTPDTGPFLKPLSQKEYDALKRSQQMAYMKMKSKIVYSK